MSSKRSFELAWFVLKEFKAQLTEMAHTATRKRAEWIQSSELGFRIPKENLKKKVNKSIEDIVLIGISPIMPQFGDSFILRETFFPLPQP